MFTGIIESIGNIEAIKPIDGDERIEIHSGALDLTDVKLGDSIAVNGVCLTVVTMTVDTFSVDVSKETLSRTSLANIQPGFKLNLEKAMQANARFGGHIVSGHVDGLASIKHISESARSIEYTIEVPEKIAPYIAEKGSVCVDGVSLTVNEVGGCLFKINIIPHTQKETIFQYYQLEDQVNIEVDMIARYVARLLSFQQEGC